MTDEELLKLDPIWDYDEGDAKVWAEELAPFMPEKIFDFHGHVTQASHRPEQTGPKEPPNPSTPAIGLKEFPHQVFAEVEKRLWPGKEVKALVLPTVAKDVYYDVANNYVAEAARIYGWESLMVVPLEDDADTILEKCKAVGALGFKPYWTFVTDKKQNDVTLEDMVPPAMREAANRAGLILTVHIPRAGRLADPVNIEGIRKLCNDAPNAKVVLAHFGRSYFTEALGDGLSLCDLPNLYPELSMVQDWEVVEAVLANFDRSKVLFGLDLPVAQLKGKCLGVNGQRHFFTKRPYAWSAHVPEGSYPVKCTIFAYEMVRAIKKACERLGLSRTESDAIFWDNACRLVDEVKNSKEKAL